MCWTKVPNGQYIVSGKYCTDPQQGSMPSCGCIAGISAMCWVNPNSIPSIYRGIKPDGLRYYQFKFYPTPGNTANYGSVDTSEKVCLNVGTSSSNSNELWPALYEKAYAYWVSQNKPGGKIITVDTFDMAGLNIWANSKAIIEYLTGRIYQEAVPANIADPWNFINQHSANPMTAWTYPQANAPAGVTYDINKIRENHAYTVLGAHPNNTDYILLRNPYGPLQGDPVLSSPDVLTTGTVTFALRPTIYLSTTTDGIFALKKSIFQSHFMKLAYQ